MTAPHDRPLVIALCPDLMMRSRIESGLDVAGYRLRVVAGPTRLAEALADEAPACILIDLEAGDDAVAVIEGLRGDPATAGIPLAAFAGHPLVASEELAQALLEGYEREFPALRDLWRPGVR